MESRNGACVVFWVGSGEGLGCGLLSDAPEIEVIWFAAAEEVQDGSLRSCDLFVIDCAIFADALNAMERLAAARFLPPTLVRIDARFTSQAQKLYRAGAAGVMVRQPEASLAQRRTELFAQMAKLRGVVPHAFSEPCAEPACDRRANEGSIDPARRAAHFAGIIGASPAICRVFDLVERAAVSHVPVLLSGATGTGKEVFARCVHRASARKKAAFVPLNCAASPESLLESELFGYKRGAFTGADRDRKGLFEEANGGTLFLDEVTETTAGFQAKLLRVLQEGEVRPLGAVRARKVDVRIIAASNRALQHEVRAGHFREDLYYRLAVFPIHIPSLQDRPEDIVPLAEHFLERYAKREGKPHCGFAPEALASLRAYDWPGNVRQLENEVQRAMVLADGEEPIGAEVFSACVREGLSAMHASYCEGESLRACTGRYEAWIIRKTLSELQGSRTKAARKLGMTREGLYKKMKRLSVSWE